MLEYGDMVYNNWGYILYYIAGEIDKEISAVID